MLLASEPRRMEPVLLPCRVSRYGGLDRSGLIEKIVLRRCIVNRSGSGSNAELSVADFRSRLLNKATLPPSGATLHPSNKIMEGAQTVGRAAGSGSVGNTWHIAEEGGQMCSVDDGEDVDT